MLLPMIAAIATISPAAPHTDPQSAESASDQASQEAQPTGQETKPTGKVLGIKYNCVHVLQLEKTLKLYREILGFKMADAEILHGDGIEGMLVMKLKVNDFTVCLSLTAPEYRDTIGPIGNTNHNHFMLLVDNIVPICDKLKKEGYELENEAYARDKYSFFEGPNGEIIGLTEYK